MKRILSYILKPYEERTFVLRLKVRFIAYCYLTEILVISAAIIYTGYANLNNPLTGYMFNFKVMGPLMGGLAVTILGVVILARGHYTAAAHLLLSCGFAIVWTVIFFDHTHIVARLDTIVLIVGLLSMTPIVILKRPLGIVFYGMANIMLLYTFIFLFREVLNLPYASFISYLSDNTITIMAVTSISYQVYSINRQALEKAELDISERKKAEEALLLSEEKYRLIAENTADLISVLDMKLHFTYVSPASMRLRGYTAEEAMQQTLDQVLTPESMKLGLTVFEKEMQLEASGTADPDRTRILELEEYKKDGSTIWMEVNLSLLRDNDRKPVGILIVSRDISERKRVAEEKRVLEERLNRAEKMESLGLLAGGVAHDLNNVLGIVIGYSELLIRDAEHADSIRSKLDIIMEGGQKAAAIVQDLLTLARRGVSGRNVINLNKIIDDNQKLQEFTNLFSHHSAVKIVTVLEPELLNISGSSVHLGKTIFNLVSNAIEAMPKGGVMTIRTTNRYLDKPVQGYDEIREGDYVILSVSDTGEGIHEADLKRIFEPFYTKKVMGRSGTGLGLAVVWGTVKDHDGYINVESEEGKGSTFTLYFPVTRKGLSAEHIAVSISEYMGKGESILIVDDVKGQRDLAEEMLRKLNYGVVSVSSGEEAMVYLKEHKADLLVLDMIMDPGMDGLDTYRSVLEICPEQKAIIVSGFSESDRVKAAQALGAGAYVRKPYVMEKLGLAVKKELERAA